MYVKQIDQNTALDLCKKGVEVKVLAPNVREPKHWTDYYPDTMQNMLEGCLFFLEAPATEDSEKEPETLPDPAPAGQESKTTRPSGKAGGKRVKVDRGKVLALHKAGRSNKWIAEDMGLHEGTVYRILKEVKEEGQDEED